MVCGGTDVDETQQTLFKNLVAFVRQSDDHAPKLTVAETLLFSGMCKDPAIRLNKKGTQENGKVGLTLAGKSMLVLFYQVNLSVQYEVSVILPLRLAFYCLYSTAFANHVLTEVTITSLTSSLTIKRSSSRFGIITCKGHICW